MMPKVFEQLVGCFGFSGPLRQYFSLCRAVSQREEERNDDRREKKMSKQPAPTAKLCPAPSHHPTAPVQAIEVLLYKYRYCLNLGYCLCICCFSFHFRYILGAYCKYRPKNQYNESLQEITVQNLCCCCIVVLRPR